jgi:hypothetical protein
MIMGFLAIVILLLDVFVISDILRGDFRDDTARILWLLTNTAGKSPSARAGM